MKTLKLFNAVVSSNTTQAEPIFSPELGLVIEPSAVKHRQEILDYYRRESLNGNQLNKTFHKSWEKVLTSTRLELAIEQVLHYLSTYGTNFTSEVYLPQEVLNVPEIKITLKVIKSYTKEEMIDKCLDLFKSGVALAEDTINDVFSILDDLDYTFTGKEGIRNKEVLIKLVELKKIFPERPEEMLRYLIYRATGSTLLIKNSEAIYQIKSSSFNPSLLLKDYGLEKMSEVFNRFKPLFLAFKSKCPKTINKISKLSKVNHKPMIENPLNSVTSRLLTSEDDRFLNKATTFTLLRAANACYLRSNNQDTFCYQIRNGKSWVKESTNVKSNNVLFLNYSRIMSELSSRLSLAGKSFYIPEGVEYALPTSEKMFVGNIPIGTKFKAKNLAVGIYWEDSWGARDIDLSGINIAGKVGWNSSYNQGGSLVYSGDITSASNGAVEYLYARQSLQYPTVVKTNVYSGSDNAGYSIIVGSGDSVTNKYMMNSNNLMLSVRCNSVERHTVQGIVIPNEDGTQSFVILNFGSGKARVSGSGVVSNMMTKALYQKYSNPLSLSSVLESIGMKRVTSREDSDIDLSLDTLEKDTILNLF